MWRGAERAVVALGRMRARASRGADVPWPVDAVITWAGPDTAARRAERASWAAASGAPATEGRWRWADYGELRYALRSLHRCAPWLRRVHVVVADEGPAWLDAAHPWVEVVPHRALFPCADELPTYSSCAIEGHLHRVPGLAERFLYLNDDMLLLEPVAPGDLVDPAGRVRVDFQWRAGRLPGGRARAGDPPHVVRARNTERLLVARYGRRLRLWPIHQGRMCRRAAFELMWGEPRFAEALELTSSARFRHPESVDPIYLQFLCAWHEGLAVLGARSSRLIAVGSDAEANRRAYRGVLRDRPAQLCVQDDLHVESPEVLADLRAFFEALEPTPAPFERLG